MTIRHTLPATLAAATLIAPAAQARPADMHASTAEAAAAIARGHAMLEAGADILDIGGERTRPGAGPVTPEEEIRRILPVVRELARAAPVSIDTRHAATMAAALEAGAEIVNDVTALRHDGAFLYCASTDQIWEFAVE